jgi:cobalamin biosynthesis Mg chelatase CobN
MFVFLKERSLYVLFVFFLAKKQYPIMPATELFFSAKAKSSSSKKKSPSKKSSSSKKGSSSSTSNKTTAKRTTMACRDQKGRLACAKQVTCEWSMGRCRHKPSGEKTSGRGATGIVLVIGVVLFIALILFVIWRQKKRTNSPTAV